MSDIVSLVHYLAWPIVALIAAIMFRGPLGRLIEVIGTRATGISIATVKIDLAQLSAGASLPAPVIESFAGTPVTASGIQPIAAAIRNASQASYLILDIGPIDARKWLTSRLYILAAMIERIRGTRCIVFTSGDRYFGTAAPREIRSELGVLFPAYERIFASVLGTIAHNNPNNDKFQHGLADDLIDQLLRDSRPTGQFPPPLRRRLEGGRRNG